ncbi:MAG: hypothetical protein AMK73_07785 [Planctomycetes bacterium SM23_32]|nr:MAG: hypothetical protein AMK73_07785 [Planctomycetes bacterium SM23_32]
MALFKSKRQRELEREIKLRQGKARIKRFIKNAQKVQKKYWRLGKEALRLGDREQFRHLAGAYIRTRDLLGRWERYLLQLETLGVRKEESATVAEFIDAIAATTKSMMRGAEPGQIASMQARMEEALTRAQAVDDMLALAMDASADSVFGAEEADEEELTEIAQAMEGEAEADEAQAYDERIARGLTEVEEQMRKEMK